MEPLKFVNFKLNNQIRLGVQVKNGIMDISEVSAAYSLELPDTMEKIIAAGKPVAEKLQKYAEITSSLIDEKNIVYAPCITNPEKIICIGLNYIDHANESKMEIPLSPVVFSKFNNALAAHKQEIFLPINAKQFDYEAELVIVIGKTAKNVTHENARSHIFGYTIGNDLSARDLQFRTGQWLLGKTCDSFAPIGPYLVTADEIDPSNLEIYCKVNGVLKQSGNTKNMIFDCAYIVSYLSKHMTLKPGDIIFTGTPAGVILGYPEGKRAWLKSGDEVSVSIENIGTLVNNLR